MAIGDFKNLKFKVQGNILYMRVKLKRELGPSASGKTTLISTSRGAMKIKSDPDIYATVVIFKKNKQDETTETDEQED